MDSYTEGDVLYENALSSLGDIAGWVMARPMDPFWTGAK